MSTISIMYIFTAISTFFIYQMLNDSYKKCLRKTVEDTFDLKHFEKVEIKHEDNEIEDVYIVTGETSERITYKYNHIKSYLGEDPVEVKKMGDKVDYLQINYWMNNEIFSVMYTDKVVFPVYTQEEIEKHPETEKKIKASFVKKDGEQMNCSDTILAYSGPKNNFYSDKKEVKTATVKDVFFDDLDLLEYDELVVVDQYDKKHTILMKKTEKILWNTSFSLTDLVFKKK
jgi:hypothetical protein